MNFREDALLPLSALQHFRFCRRQCALIHLEMAWAENRLTAEGRVMHERVHNQETESRGNLRIARGLPLRSLRLGLAGVADVVEFRRAQSDAPWQPFPVEYKRGKPKPDGSDELQLCAQALCLEEMLEVPVPAGALFYGQSKRRHEVVFTPALREDATRTADELHALLAAGSTPPPEPGKKCDGCSLREICMPKVAARKSVKAYLNQRIEK